MALAPFQFNKPIDRTRTRSYITTQKKGRERKKTRVAIAEKEEKRLYMAFLQHIKQEKR